MVRLPPAQLTATIQRFFPSSPSSQLLCAVCGYHTIVLHGQWYYTIKQFLTIDLSVMYFSLMVRHLYINRCRCLVLFTYDGYRRFQVSLVVCSPTLGTQYPSNVQLIRITCTFQVMQICLSSPRKKSSLLQTYRLFLIGGLYLHDEGDFNPNLDTAHSSLVLYKGLLGVIMWLHFPVYIQLTVILLHWSSKGCPTGVGPTSLLSTNTVPHPVSLYCTKNATHSHARYLLNN